MSPVSPATPAQTPLAAFQASRIVCAPPDAPAGGPGLPVHPDDVIDGEGEEQAIAAEYRRRLAGLRHLPQAARASAARAAKLWRQVALRVLRDKQAAARRARQIAQRWRAPPPT